MDKIRYGIISTGKIANALADAISGLDDCEVVAVGSRTLESAQAFAAKYNIPAAYGSYEELVNDPNVDVVYIGTPHSHHYDNLLLALGANKHILNEKAFTINADQAEHVINIAREKNLFLMEAMWMRFQPSTVQARQWVAEGLIGELRYASADLSVYFEFDPKHRLFDLDLGGGALLDLGIYPISFVHYWLGVPDDVWSVAFLGETGSDELDAMMFAYADGRTAHLSCGTRYHGTKEAQIVGTNGYIKFGGALYNPPYITLKQHDLPERTIEFSREENTYKYEVMEVNRCIRAGLTESPVITLDHTLEMMRLMDSMREEWGLEYPME